VLAHLVKDVLKIERDRSVASAVVGRVRPDDVVTEMCLETDRASSRRCAQIRRKRLCVGIEAEDRCELGALREEVDDEGRTPTLGERIDTRRVVRRSGADDDDDLLGHSVSERSPLRPHVRPRVDRRAAAAARYSTPPAAPQQRPQGAPERRPRNIAAAPGRRAHGTTTPGAARARRLADAINRCARTPSPLATADSKSASVATARLHARQLRRDVPRRDTRKRPAGSRRLCRRPCPAAPWPPREPRRAVGGHGPVWGRQRAARVRLVWHARWHRTRRHTPSQHGTSFPRRTAQVRQDGRERHVPTPRGTNRGAAWSRARTWADAAAEGPTSASEGALTRASQHAFSASRDRRGSLFLEETAMLGRR